MSRHSVEQKLDIVKREDSSRKRSKPNSAIHIPPSFWDYYPPLAQQLNDAHPSIRFDLKRFGNGMPLLLSGRAKRVVMPIIIAGDNFEEAKNDIDAAGVFTQHRERIGKNVDELRLLLVHGDLRQDQAALKPIPGKERHEVAIVEAQESTTLKLAHLMADIAHVSHLLLIDGHSQLAVSHFENVGIPVINVSAAFLMIDVLRERGLLEDNIENVICGVDFGNLSLVEQIIKRYKKEGLDLDLAVIQKWRVADESGVKSHTERELIYGNVKGKRVILMDDMISSGETLVGTVELLLQQGAERVIVCGTHPVFAPGYYDHIKQLLADDRVEVVMTTNTLPLVRPSQSGNRDLPYIAGGMRGLNSPRKEMEMIDIQPFVGMLAQVMMFSETAAEMRAKLAKWIVDLQPPYELAAKLTGMKIEKPNVTMIYTSEGEYIPLIEQDD